MQVSLHTPPDEVRSKRRILAALLTIVFSIFSTLPARAAAPQDGNAHLDAVEVTGSSRFTSKQIVEAIGLRTGTTTNREGLQQIADKLSAIGTFATVRYHFTTVATGVRVTYEVTDAAALPVTFDNFPWFSDEELSAGIKKSVILFEGSAPATGTLLDTMDEALMKFMDAHGIHAQVTHRVIPQADKDLRVLEFHVEDAAITIQSFDFSDPLAKTEHHIQDRLPDLIGKPYSRSKIDAFEFEQVRPVYLAHGYLRVQFDSPEVKFPEPPANPLAGAVAVTSRIETGPAYKFSGIEWSGNAAVSNADLNGIIQMQPGDTADGTSIEGIWKRAIEKYQENGFLGADLSPTQQFDNTAGKVSYAVKITEGPQYHMGNLVLTGLSVEGERRIRRAFPIPKDALFDKTAYDIFIDKGMKAAFQGLPVHYDKIGNFLQLDTPNAKVDVLLDFQ